MADRAKVVIIGGGVAGCSTAYHLSKMGETDVLVLEQGPLFTQGNSTGHAPGIIFQTNFSRTMTKFAQRSVELYSSLKLDDKPCYHAVGGMEVAYTDERYEDLKRKLGAAMSWGVEARLITPGEAKEMIPLMDTEIIKGAYFVNRDGVAKAPRACEAMAREAQTKGVRFRGETEVTGIVVSQGRVRGVETKDGRIDAEQVLITGGIWGPRVARMAGIKLPLSPMEHLYARTDPLPELHGTKAEVTQPVVRHQDRAMYFRQDGETYGVGSYLHEPLLVSADDLGKRGEGAAAPSIHRFTPEHFRRGWDAAVELFPPLKGAGLSYAINGMFSFTVDGMPIMGPTREVEGLWVAEGVWITHSGGVGKAMAEWMVDGAPSLDLRECDVNRFHGYAYSPSYISTRAAQQYREVYDIIHPAQQLKSPRQVRLTPFYGRHQELGAVFFENVGWERPQWFEANRPLLDGKGWPVRSGWEARFWSPVQGAEHHATRNGVAIYDMTPFTKIAVQGPSALTYLERICANRVDQPLGRVVYTQMLNGKGGIVCDLTVSRLGLDSFLVVTGGSTGMHDLAWMQAHLPGDGSVSLTDVSAGMCCLGLWGPRAQDLLGMVSKDDLSAGSFRPFTAKRIIVGNVPVLALRVSYVGENGWELYADTGYGLMLWDTLREAGRGFGMVAAGAAAFDSLRLEKGYRLWGNDIHTEYNPLEAGLEFAVKMDKGDFIGRDALQKAKEEGLTRKLSRMYFDEPGRVVLGKEPIIHEGGVVGYVTSSNYGYTLGTGIALGYLPLELSKEGTGVEVYYFGRRYAATVVSDGRMS
ncbi:MAG: FAD-dependent oxidoreductase [Thaumarchaeota archaeon]|nr:FAD-dependent oxidoreductase [Nitrososphaerota archaeon]